MGADLETLRPLVKRVHALAFKVDRIEWSRTVSHRHHRLDSPLERHGRRVCIAPLAFQALRHVIENNRRSEIYFAEKEVLVRPIVPRPRPANDPRRHRHRLHGARAGSGKGAARSEGYGSSLLGGYYSADEVTTRRTSRDAARETPNLDQNEI